MSKVTFRTFGCSNTSGIDISYFCEDLMEIGDLCFLKGYSDHLVTNYKLAEFGAEIIGISMNNVVVADARTYVCRQDNYEVSSGSKIQILKRGQIVLKFPPKWKIPAKQKLYSDPITGKISWRKGLKYCKTTSAQDELGFVYAEVNF